MYAFIMHSELSKIYLISFVIFGTTWALPKRWQILPTLSRHRDYFLGYVCIYFCPEYDVISYDIFVQPTNNVALIGNGWQLLHQSHCLQWPERAQKNKTVRETRSTKVKIGANIYSTQSQSAWFHISGQAYGTKVTNIYWIKSRHQQNSKPEGNCMQKTTKLLTKFLHHADMEEKALLGLHIGIKMRCRLKIILRCTRGEIWKVKMKFEKWKWKFKSE